MYPLIAARTPFLVPYAVTEPKKVSESVDRRVRRERRGEDEFFPKLTKYETNRSKAVKHNAVKG